jgi:hypothetical protein
VLQKALLVVLVRRVVYRALIPFSVFSPRILKEYTVGTKINYKGKYIPSLTILKQTMKKHINLKLDSWYMQKAQKPASNNEV